MANYITIEKAENGYMASVRDDELVDDSTTDGLHVFTSMPKLLQWVKETLKDEPGE